jgi:hypothetical protein
MGAMFFLSSIFTAKIVRNQTHDVVFKDAETNAVVGYFANPNCKDKIIVINLIDLIISFSFNFLGAFPLIGVFFRG